MIKRLLLPLALALGLCSPSFAADQTPLKGVNAHPTTFGTGDTVAVAHGGTGAATAGGAALDNISGLASTGFLTRTGTATYSFQSLTNGITLGNLAQAGANTVTGNATGSTANLTALPMPSCSSASSALTWTSASGFGCNTISGGSGTVTHTVGGLTSGQLIIGNGSADIAVLGSLGTTTTLLHGNAAGAPTFGPVATGDISANAVTLAKLATQADKTILANISGSTAVPTAAGLSSILDNVFGATQGNILVRDTSAWIALGAGTAGNALVSNGAGTTPSYQPVGAGAGGAVTLISKVVTSGSQTSVTFSSIPNTYSHLQLVVWGRSLAAAFNDGVQLQFNGDTAANYSAEQIAASATTPSANQAIGAASMQIAALPAASVAAGFAGSTDTIIPNYASTAFFKVPISKGGFVNAASSGNVFVLDFYGVWASTAAINAIKVFLSSGSGFANGTVVSLYGIS
jgi:hypothetical protein